MGVALRHCSLVVFLENALGASCAKLRLLRRQGAVGLLLGSVECVLLRDAGGELVLALILGLGSLS